MIIFYADTKYLCKLYTLHLQAIVKLFDFDINYSICILYSWSLKNYVNIT